MMPPRPESNYPRQPMMSGPMGLGVKFEYIGTGFNMLFARPGFWIGQSLMVALLMLLIGGIFYSPVIFYVMNNIESASKGGFENFTVNLIALPSSILLYPFVMAVNTAMGLSAINQRRGYAPQSYLGDVLSKVGTWYPAGLIVGVAVQIGMLLCYIPGFVAMSLFTFVGFYCVMKGMTGMTALKASVEAMKPYWIPMVGLVIVTSIVSSLGIIACCIGIFLTMPLTAIVMGLHWDDFSQYEDWKNSTQAPQPVGPAPVPEAPRPTDFGAPPSAPNPYQYPPATSQPPAPPTDSPMSGPPPPQS